MAHRESHDVLTVDGLTGRTSRLRPAEGLTFEGGLRHQRTFMCDDIDATGEDLRRNGVELGGDPAQEELASPPCWSCRAGSR